MLKVQLLILAMFLQSFHSQFTCTNTDFNLYNHIPKLVKELRGTFYTLYTGGLNLECQVPTWTKEDNIIGYVKEVDDCCVELDILDKTPESMEYSSTPLTSGCTGAAGGGEMKIIAEVKTAETGSCVVVLVCADTKYGFLVQCRLQPERSQEILDKLNTKLGRKLGESLLPSLTPVNSTDCSLITNCPP